MKEKVQLGIGGMFAVAMVVFFATGKIPLNVFLPVVTGALVWLFKDIEQARILKQLDDLLKQLNLSLATLNDAFEIVNKTLGQSKDRKETK